MILKHNFHTSFFAFLILLPLTNVVAQNQPAPTGAVPIYDVTVIGRTVNAINYQYRSGPTQIDFKGTVLLPQARGDATVESKAGRTEIDAHFERLAATQRFGTEYLTYVLWAITPEGQVKNLGEVLPGSSDKAHTHVTTELQSFGLIVTAEPYAAVRHPGDVVVMENQVRPETLGATEPIQVHVELMPRGSYTYNVPAGPIPQGRKISTAEYEETLELYQAQNAIQIAEAQGADKYATEVLADAKSKYDNARNLQTRHSNRNAVIAAARDATQTAEDARTLAAARKHDSELASAHGDIEHEQQLRQEAEAKARRAESEATNAEAQKSETARELEAERKARREAEDRVASLSTAPSVPPPPPPAVAPPPPAASAPPVQDESHMTLRAQLFAQLNGLEALDTGRGLEVILRDSDFDGTTLIPNASVGLGKVAGIIMSHPGLAVEIDGNSDTAGTSGEHFSLDRANSVKDALMRIGLKDNQVAARGLGNSRPSGPNSTAKGKEDNRRVEVIIHGDAIGNQPGWDKSYPLDSRSR